MRRAPPAPNLLTRPPRGRAPRRQRGVRPREIDRGSSRPQPGRGDRRTRGLGGRRGRQGLTMTSEKHLKARIRARMARTGERYATARRHVAGAGDPTTHAATTDRGYLLRGGVHPESAILANLLHRHGADLSEAMVLGIGG